MKWTSERGQSLLEAALGIAVLGTFGIAVHLTGRWHDLSVDSLNASVSTGFLHTFGQKSAPGARLDQSAAHKLVDGPISGLMKEWKISDDGLIVVRSGSAGGVTQVRLPAWAPAPLIVRYSYLHGGTGHGRSDAQVQTHTGSSTTAWSAAATSSAELVRRVGATVRPVDSPWQRPAPDSDWLTHWSGFVPDTLLRRPRQ